MINILYGLPIVLAVVALVLCVVFGVKWLVERYRNSVYIVVSIPFILFASYLVGSALQR